MGEKDGDLKISGEGKTKPQKKTKGRVLNESEEGTADINSTVLYLL